MKNTDYLKAWAQWIGLFLITVVGTIVGLVIVYPLAIAWLKFKYQVLKKSHCFNPFGESVKGHRQKYKDAGSSGHWDYWNIGGLFWLWGNDEDGFLGEPSGKHSAREGGKERSFMAMYRWSLRNPFNNAKRYWKPMRCRIDRCVIEWEGEGKSRDVNGCVLLNDNVPVQTGWYLCKATDKETGRVYYGYRCVESLGIKAVGPDVFHRIKHARFGFKISPRHAFEEHDADDKYKGFTFRYTRNAKAN